jgi:hypothetical protein
MSLLLLTVKREVTAGSSPAFVLLYTHHTSTWSLQGRATNILNLSVKLVTVLTERRGCVVSTPASYSGGPGFKYRPGHRLS